MEKEQDYLQQLSDIRSMMERSLRFTALSGKAMALAGLFALAGFLANALWVGFMPTTAGYPYDQPEQVWPNMGGTIALAIIVLALSLAFGIALTGMRARQAGHPVWNHATRRLLWAMATPLLTGGLLMLVLLYHKLAGLRGPGKLVFYCPSPGSGSYFSLGILRPLGALQIALGLLAASFIPLSPWLWTLGFGLLHIAFGLYIHYKYQRSPV